MALRIGLVLLLAGTVFVFAPDSVLPFETSKVIYFRTFLDVLLAVWLINALIKKKVSFPRLSMPLTICAILIVAANLISFVNSANHERSFWGSFFRNQGLYTMAHYGILFFFVMSIYTKSTWKFFGRSLGAIVFALSATNIWFFIVNRGDYRAAGFLGNPVYLGQLMALLFPLVLSFLLASHKKMRAWWGCVLILAVITLILTGNRASLIGLFTALIVYGGFIAVKMHRKNILHWSFLAVALGLVAFIIFNTQCTGLCSKNPLAQKFLLNSYESLQPVRTRIEIWKGTVEMIKNKPIFGAGQDMFDKAFAPYTPKALTDYPMDYADRAHNIVLDLLATYGIFGVLAYTAFFTFMAVRGITFLKHTKSSFEFLIVLGFMIGFFALLLSVQFSFLTLVHHVFFWTLLAFFFVFSTVDVDAGSPQHH